MAYMMGIDLGTSSLKVIIADKDGNILAQSSASYQYDMPYRGYAEQDPDVWWNTCRGCVNEALGRLNAPRGEIKGVGFSGQMHGAVFLDENRRTVRPAILHCDTRSVDQLSEIRGGMRGRNIEALNLNPLYTGFLLPSLLWVRGNEPELFKKIRFVCLPKDYLKLKLSGNIVSDYSDASATLAFDIVNLGWSDEILESVGIEKDIFPECRESTAVIGKVTRGAAEETGLPEGTLVVNGGGDQVMQAIGNGAIGRGQATVNIGSSGQVCFQTERPIKNSALNTNTFCGYGRGRWITMGATMTAGLSLKWFSSLFGASEYEELSAEIASLNPGSGGLIFLPYLNGERTPHMDPDLSGAFFGINPNTGRTQMARAVMEGVTYSLMNCIEICRGLGLEAKELIASGGGARSSPWLQMQADVFDIPLRTSVNREQAALGAAIVAGVGSGIFGDLEQACHSMVQYNERIYTPDDKNHRVYMEYYKVFKSIFLASHSEIDALTLLGKKYAAKNLSLA